MTTAEKYNALIEKIPEVFEAGKAQGGGGEAFGLKGSASGEIVALRDVAPVEHNVGVKLASKNLCDYTKTLGNSYGTFTIIDGGVLWHSGSKYYIRIPCSVKAGETVIFSCKCATAGSDTVANLAYHDASQTSINSVTTAPYGTPWTATFDVDYVYMYKANPTVELTADMTVTEIQLEKGTTATPYTPYIADVSTTKLMATGKNLVNGDTNSIKLVEYVTNTGSTSSKYGYVVEGLPAGTYTINCINKGLDGSEYIYLNLIDKDGYVRVHKDCFDDKYTIPANGDKNNGYLIASGDNYSPVRCYIQDGDTLLIFNAVGNTLDIAKTVLSRVDIQLEVGDKVTDYEPYIEPVTFTPDSEGNVKGVRSIYPTTTLYTDTPGVAVNAECYLDAEKVVQDLTDLILSLGGTV